MERRFVPLRLHAALDYATGPTLVAAPRLLRMNGARGSTLPPKLVGAATTALTALSDHGLAARRVVPMRAHLAADAVGGVLLAALPWVTGAARGGARYWLPHALVGANEVTLAFVTRTEDPPASRMRQLLGSRKALVAAPFLAVALGVLAWRSGAVRFAADVLEEAADELEDAAGKLEQWTDKLEDKLEKEDD